MLWKRIASAAVLIPIVAAAVYLGGLWLSALVLAAACLATYEYLRLTDARRLDYFFGLAWVVALAADGRWPSLGLLPWCLALGLIASLTAEVSRHNAPDSLRHWALTTAGSLYIGFLASHFARLRQLPQGTEWLVLALLGTWVCDSAAYFVGTAWGRRRFFPAISPKKTREGALGGLVGGVLAAVLLGRWLVGLGWAAGLTLGVLVVFGATFGDLAESVIKRQVGVKDSSQLIPGHGGMLDRIDSLLFVVPIVYYFARMIGAG